MVNVYSWYFHGNPFKVMFRKHYCYKCGNPLSKKRHKIIVNEKSLEAKYYWLSPDIDSPSDDWAFIHKVFYCPHCLKSIEYITQTNLEDIDIIIQKVKKEYSKYNNTDPYKFTIRKCFEKYDGSIVKNIESIEQIINLHIIVELPNKKPITMKFPIYRTTKWERPYYFKIKKKDVIWWKPID